MKYPSEIGKKIQRRSLSGINVWSEERRRRKRGAGGGIMRKRWIARLRY